MEHKEALMLSLAEAISNSLGLLADEDLHFILLVAPTKGDIKNCQVVSSLGEDKTVEWLKAISNEMDKIASESKGTLHA